MKTLSVVVVGSEILLGLRPDTNSGVICRTLGPAGYACSDIVVVGDDRAAICAQLRRALAESDMVVVTGGLGPTSDDVTREAISEAIERPLAFREEVASELKSRYGPEIGSSKAVLRQAYAPKDSRLIMPRLGSAPGLDISIGERRLIALPGVPSEMKEMLSRVAGELPPPEDGLRRLRTIKTCGRGEAYVEGHIAAVARELKLTSMTILAMPGEVHLTLVAEASSSNEATEAVSEAERLLVGRLGDDVYGYDEDALESVVGSLLSEQRLTLGVAESCTGGMIASRITDVPGSSAYFIGGVVAYADQAKVALLGVTEDVLASEGAVSPGCALEMESGARRLFSCDMGLSTTGIAGPTGGRPDKPVGLVYVAVGDRQRSHVKELSLGGGRQAVALGATQAALVLLRSRLLGLDED